ncbi:chemotaxis protein CheW [Pisciglobus halotolerans]|uniref:Purine-binding chemotaxis protein CheW n=1 Tax=Pisciglobus halotolerans TaxID=745365 RepID=A0A1I3ANS1_9LACT|nr:chemotaxis protein CheW [Pisciglobus halotolerans]SFH51673.1 purine-binding chemotaxis protein CheW [Pisciglobus halotolerans]
MQIITFKLNEKVFALDASHTEEMTKQLVWKAVPTAPKWIQGLINLRGEIISLINLQQLLYPSSGMEEMCYNNSIIMKNADGKMAFMVDEILAVTEIEASEIKQVDQKETSKIAGILSVKGEIASLIQLDGLIPKSEGES